MLHLGYAEARSRLSRLEGGDAAAGDLGRDHRGVEVAARMTPRVLLLADQPWDAGGGGAVILRSLIGGDLGGLVWVTPAKATGDATRVGLTAGSLARRGRSSAFADTRGQANRLALEVRELMTVTNSAAVWAVLHGATVSVAARLATLGVPLHCTVHDDPVHA